MAAAAAANDGDEDEMPAWEATEVVGGLWIGTIDDAANAAGLAAHNITLVVSAHDQPQPPPVSAASPDDTPRQLGWVRIECGDAADDDLLQHFDPVADIITASLDCGGDGGGVLVHCLAGQSRSVSLVAAYLMRVRGHSLRELLTYDPATGEGDGLIQQRRPDAFPNRGFWRQLAAYDAANRNSRIASPISPRGSTSADQSLYTEDELPGAILFEKDGIDAIISRFRVARAARENDRKRASPASTPAKRGGSGSPEGKASKTSVGMTAPTAIVVEPVAPIMPPQLEPQRPPGLDRATQGLVA
mmetsp:Transcript_32763/g.98984  ORF Transcript_32763/g.98984 Transcript_32763/m.98984 type:complete len:302 (+) Transcript_32763:191-1096(+)